MQSVASRSARGSTHAFFSSLLVAKIRRLALTAMTTFGSLWRSRRRLRTTRANLKQKLQGRSLRERAVTITSAFERMVDMATSTRQYSVQRYQVTPFSRLRTMPEDNHYVPIFYLKRWAGADNQVRVYSRPYRITRVMRKYPAGIGYMTDLYTAADPDAAVATYLEREFFKVSDDSGAKALGVIEAGPWGSMHGQIRTGWTRFVISLLHRNPEQIAKSHETVSLYASIMRSKYE